jgi:hypothetical protein
MPAARTRATQACALAAASSGSMQLLPTGLQTLL